MAKYIVNSYRILFDRPEILLARADLPELCQQAEKYRIRFISLCVFIFSIGAVGMLIYHKIPFVEMPKIMLGLLVAFSLSAMFASRFSRLCSIETHARFAMSIRSMSKKNPYCAEYLAQVRQQQRPFTRLDLAAMSRIYLSH
ncbi:hypothetical protein [Acinetobacter sp. MB5]|uniref:hypothetical protein n=1 Tax=Acinetobacter sp. MB5 TaxID=2069438 RepID=UPI0013A6CA20|nr:hypothetical protein [Acinetobacter sp. MB5]